MTEHILYTLLYIHRTDIEVHLLLIQIYSSKACHITNAMYTNAVLVFHSTGTDPQKNFQIKVAITDTIFSFCQ